MGDRVRAAEESTEEKPAAPVIVRPEPAVSNRQSADLLSGPAAAAARVDDVVGLGGPAGNRATAQWLGAGSAAPAPAPGPAPVVPQKAPAPGGQQNPAPQGTTAAVQPPPTDWIESLPPHIKQQIDNFTDAQVKSADQGDKRLTDLRTQHRITFMETMRWAMGNDDGVIKKHFQEIDSINVGDSDELWLHVSARERLAAVKSDLEAQGIPLPQTTVGLGMRADHLNRADKGRGWFTHAVGFAIDFRALQTPKISDDRLITLFQLITGGRPDMKTSVESEARIDLEIKMGQGTAKPEDSKKLLDSIEAEYTRLTEGSEKFRTDLPKATLDRLREVENARYGVALAKRALVRLLKRTKPKPATKDEIAAARQAVPEAEERYQKIKAEVLPELPKLFAPWTKKIDDRIAEIDKHFADRGVDVEKLTSDFGLDERDKKISQLRAAEARLTGAAGANVGKVLQLHRDALDLQARIDAAKGALPDPDNGWGADLGKVEEATTAVLHGLDPLEGALADLVPKAKLEVKPAAPVKPGTLKQETIAALRKAAERLGPRFTELAVKIVPAAATFDQTDADLTAAKEDVAARRKYREDKAAEIGGGTDKASMAKGRATLQDLIKEKFELITLKSVKDSLLTNANGFVFGDKLEPHNPMLDQLLGVTPDTKGGFFTPDADGGEAAEKEAKAGTYSPEHGYGLVFIKTMVSHGFEPGMAWRGGSDPMHFELAEGRRFLTSAGAQPVVAGTTPPSP